MPRSLTPTKPILYVVAVAVALAATQLVAKAAVFAFMPGSLEASYRGPYLALEDPSTPSVNVTLGLNQSSAFITIKAVDDYILLTRNPGFDTGPDYWYFSPGVYLNNASWATVAGNGFIVVNGTMPGLYSSDAFALIQPIVFPNKPGSIVGNITWRTDVYQLGSPLFYNDLYILIVGIYDPVNGIFIASNNTGIIDAATWNGTTFVFRYTLDPTGIEPGVEYYFVVLFNVYHFGVGRGGGDSYFEFWIDSAFLEAKPAFPSFAGTIVAGENLVGVPYTARLVLTSLLTDYAVNVTLYLSNATAYASTPIDITLGSVINGSTSFLPIQQMPGYSDLRVHLAASIPVGATVILELQLVYNSSSGIEVRLPLMVEIIDPPRHRHRGFNCSLEPVDEPWWPRTMAKGFIPLAHMYIDVHSLLETLPEHQHGIDELAEKILESIEDMYNVYNTSNTTIDYLTVDED